MNKPYVKEVVDGEIINPIKGSYPSDYPNRKQRRKYLQKDRFRGNSKGVNLSVFKDSKYSRELQVIFCVDPETKKPTGEKRVVKHYRKC